MIFYIILAIILAINIITLILACLSWNKNYKTYYSNQLQIAIFLTGKYCDETRNLLHTIDKYEDLNAVIAYTLDKDAETCMKKMGIKTKFINAKIPDTHTDACKGGGGQHKVDPDCNNNFKKIVKYKIQMIHDLLKNGPVLFMDTDIVLFKNISKYLEKLKGDIVIQYGSADLGQSNWHCTGLIYLRPTKLTKLFVQDWLNDYNEKLKNIESLGGLGDQETFNNLLNNRKPEYKDIKIGTMPPKLFPNGCLYFDKNIKKDAYLVHNNCIKGLENKIKRFKKHGLWYI